MQTGKVIAGTQAKKPVNNSAWSNRRHLLDTKDLSLEEVEYLFSLAKKYKENGAAAAPLPAVHQHEAMANVFYENSTRTRCSFELAGKMLGLSVVNLDPKTSSVNKGETIEDTGRTLKAMGFKIIVQRHSAAGAAQLLADVLGDAVHVINAGDGANAHPTQALLDAFTMQEFERNLAGAKIAIIGDIAHSRVARSNLWLLKLLGAEVHFSGPPTLMPAHLEDLGAKVHLYPQDAIKDADFVMVLRLQLERQANGLIPSLEEYTKVFGIDHQKLALAKPGVKVMHPGPVNRGLEISSALADDLNYSLIERQISNGLFIRMAVLHTLLINS